MTNQHLPTIDYELCTACSICVAVCPTGALAMSENGPYFFSPENCTYCTDCESLCPSSAISCDFEITWEPETSLDKQVSGKRNSQLQEKGDEHE
jgi:ferredoxin